ncbi:MAG: ribokinase [Lentisphaeria bacterium]|nr:ribokinase [Lentisphaeria bacterium]NQZ68541.1 ribokinase [Lentisphaeria bacterium]
MKKRLCIIGSSNIDFIMTLDHLPRPGETVTGGTYMQAMGGKGANQAVAAARAGAEVTFVSCLGDDIYRPGMIQGFQDDGIDTSHIKSVDNTSSGTALIMIQDGGENCIGVAPGANYKLLPEDIDPALVAESGYIILQNELLADTANHVLKLAKEVDTKVIMNYAPVCEMASSIVDLHGLIVNETEANALLGKDPDDTGYETSIMALAEKGPYFVILTLGSEGALIVEDSTLFKVASFRVDAQDTTAAGDTFCGALAAALIDGQSLQQAACFANAAAAISVTRIGAQPSIPTLSEINSFLSENKD